MKKIIIGFLFLILFCGLISCKKKIENNFEYKIECEDVVEVGDKLKLSINYDGKVNFSISDENIAEIDGNVLTAKKSGKLLISTIIDKQNITKEVEVLDPNIGVIINGVNSLIVGDSYKFTTTLSRNTTHKVVYSVSDDKICSIDQEGNVTALQSGFVKIYASILSTKEEYNLEIKDKEPEIIPSVKIKDIDSVYIGESKQLELDVMGLSETPSWFSSDNTVISVSSTGLIKGIKEGNAIITVNVGTYTDSVDIIVKKKPPVSINVYGPNIMYLETTISLRVVVNPNTADNRLYFESLTKDIVDVDDNGTLTPLKVGNGIIKVSSAVDENVYSLYYIEIKEALPSIKIIGDNNVIQGKTINLNIESNKNFNVEDFEWSSSNGRIAVVSNGIVLGLTTGDVVVTAVHKLIDGLQASYAVHVDKFISPSYSQSDIDRVNEIIKGMTLEEKLGQMFIVGFSGTTFTATLDNAIKNYHFGNIIYMGANCTSYSTLSKMSNDIQDAMVLNNKIPAFISTDQEGGRVARLTNGATHFISEMAMGATGDYNNTYIEGAAMAEELINYGINFDLAPVLDVNNNPANPIIGVRSYSDDSVKAALYGVNMINGLKSGGVMACAKHFPGHGNTAVDSHYGLPMITSSIDELYKIELAPFISAISNGIDAIMTTHIIFDAIDSTYPATLSSKVLQGLLRNELGFDGLIVTDGMQMQAITKYFGTTAQAAVLAVKAGVDMLTYTDLNGPIAGYNGVKTAISNGEISIDRIDDSVRRILLTKLVKYNLDNNYKSKGNDISELVKAHEELNVNFAMKALTKVYGDFSGLDKNKSTLIISPKCSYTIDSSLADNSIGCYASKYLKNNGHAKVDYLTVSNNITSTESSNALNKIKSYDQVVLCFSNVKTSNYSNTTTFVNNVLNTNKNAVVIALDSPYDYLNYKNLNNYFCIYGYQKASVIAISKYLNGEFEITSISPIKF